MKNIKQFFTYLVVGALVMALSISCKSNEEPSRRFKVSDLKGTTWSGDAGSFTIDNSGTLTFIYQGTTYKYIPPYQSEEEVTFYFISAYDSAYDQNAQHADGAKRKIAIFSFDSSSCEVSTREDTYSGTYPNGSWQSGIANSIGTFTK